MIRLIATVGGLATLGVVYTTLKPLHNAIAPSHSNAISAWMATLSTATKIFLSRFKSRPSSSSNVKRVGNKYHVSYTLNGKQYVMITQGPRGPSEVDEVFDEHGNNVSNNVLKYLGPLNDFHGTPLTPKDLGYDRLVFETMDCETLTFTSDQVITLVTTSQS
jgi:hypothetical protein